MGAKKYANEVIKEGKRVRWPKKEKFFPVLIAVLLVCGFTALILCLEDWAAGTLIQQLKDWFSGMNKGGASSEAAETALAAIKSIL